MPDGLPTTAVATCATERFGIPGTDLIVAAPDAPAARAFLTGQLGESSPDFFEQTRIDRENGREGDVLFVNGQVLPAVSIRSGEIQRWRLINASAGRYYRLSLAGHPFLQIGTDGGLFERPVERGEAPGAGGPSRKHQHVSDQERTRIMATMHEVDYKVFGDDLQFVEVELDPQEAAIAEAGGMMYMEDGIEMQTIFGDGSQQNQGFLGSLLGAGKRLLTGESLFMTVFMNKAHGKQRVAFAAPYPGKIMAVHLSELGGELIVQKDSFLCAAKGVSIGIAFQKKLGVGLFGGEGFIMQRLQGDGLTFVHAGGTLHPVDLAAGQTLRVDTGCLVALQPSVGYEIQYVGKIKTALFGGEGLFFATLTGPGRAWLQSLPLSRMADRIYKASPAAFGSRREEGSILGGIGGLIDGDN